MSTPAEVELAFLVDLADDPSWAHTEAKRMDTYNQDHGAMYADGPIPVSLKPNFISSGQRALLEEASGKLWGALEAFVDVFLETPALQETWDVTEEEMDLYEIDPGYRGAIQIARFDAFLDGSDVSFVEFNCDSPGGAGYGDVIHEAFLEVVHRNPHLQRGYELEQRSRLRALQDTLLDCYASWREGHPDRPEDPYVVLADWPDVGSRPDIDITIERFNRQGLDAAFADPRQMELDGDQLVHQGRRVDVVYKRVITEELLHEEDAQPLLDAYRAGTVCMVNAPRSVIVGNKKILAALRDEDVQREMTPQQREAIQRYVPWTTILQDGPVTMEGLRVDLRDLLLENKDEFVLKPARGYGGDGVNLGFETDPSTWGRLVDEHMGSGAWIVQRLAKIPKGLYPTIEEGACDLSPRNVNVNPFVFGGEYAGAYTRISRSNVINVSHGGGLVPTVTVHDDAGPP